MGWRCNYIVGWQAALCTVALDYVNAHKSDFADPGQLERVTALANIVLTVAVLSIVMTAPVFGALMSWSGHAWLEQPGAGEGDEGGGQGRDEAEDDRTAKLLGH